MISVCSVVENLPKSTSLKQKEVIMGQQIVGLFGGSFDPIHFGHLHLATELMKIGGLGEVWFCPARLNPFKQQGTPIHHRGKMVSLAISDNPRFILLDTEMQREGPSYTIDTLQLLLEEEQKRPIPRQICVMMSDELIPEFFHWREAGKIVEKAKLLIGSRNLSAPPALQGDPNICRAIQQGWTPTSVKNISSTNIRERLRKRQDCRRLVPKKVLDYISENRLYLDL